MIRGDFHCHTRFSDGTVSPGRRVVLSLNAGNRFQWVTDHDVFEGGRRAQLFAKQFNIPIAVFPGVEFSTEVGHVLSLGMRQNPFEGRLFTRIDDVAAEAQKNGWMLISAHATWPSHRKHWLTGRIQRMFHEEGVFQALEIVNMYEDHLELMAYYDEHGPFPFTAGSDSHHDPHRATAECWVDADADEASILKAIRESRSAVWVSPALSGRSEPAYGETRWFGRKEWVARAKQDCKAWLCPANPGVTITAQGDELLPGETCKVSLLSKTSITVRWRSPQFDFDETLQLEPGQMVERSFVLPESLEGDYAYWLVEAGQPVFHALAECFVKPKTRSKIQGSFVKAHVSGSDGTQAQLPATVSDVRMRMPRFESWDALPRSVVAPAEAPACVDYRGAGKDIRAEWGLAWDATHLYVAVDVSDPVFCQPFENRGLWDGDCIRFGICPARVGDVQPIFQSCQLDWFGAKALFDLALTPEGSMLLWKWKLHAGAGEGFDVRIERSGTETQYRAILAWNFIGIPAPAPQDAFFVNMQIHEHDGKKFRGFISPVPGCDLYSFGQTWPLAFVE